jgi:pimeloyl-ACP methyl ester carboxylesterase
VRTLRPFQQWAWSEVPAHPRVPHRWAETTPVDRTVTLPGGAPLGWHARTFGQGPPLVLVHGLMTASYSWRYQLERLGRRFTLWMPDLPGAGATDPLPGPHTTPSLAAALAAWMDASGLHHVPMVGNSLGGLIALHLTLDHPGRISRLVNLHSPGRPTPRLHALHAALSVPGSHALLDALIRRSPERWVHRHVHYADETLKSREEADVWAAPLRTPQGRAAFTSWLQHALAPADLRAFQRRLEARVAAGEAWPLPLRLVYAPADPMVPPAVGDWLHARLPGSDMVRLPGGSHFAHVDAPDAFEAAVADWLAGGP